MRFAALGHDEAASEFETCNDPEDDNNRDRNFKVTNFGRFKARRSFILSFSMLRYIHVVQLLVGNFTADVSKTVGLLVVRHIPAGSKFTFYCFFIFLDVELRFYSISHDSVSPCEGLVASS